MGNLIDHQGTYPPQGGTEKSPRALRGLADKIQRMTGAAIILVNMFNTKSEMNPLARVQNQGQTCVR